MKAPLQFITETVSDYNYVYNLNCIVNSKKYLSQFENVPIVS